jgi:hypothetical protein
MAGKKGLFASARRVPGPWDPPRNDYATRPSQIMAIEPMAAAEIDVSGS